MTMGEIVAFTTIGTAVIGIVGFVLGNARFEHNKRTRIYERLDENKQEAANTYVRQDICSVKSEGLRNDVSEIKQDVKKLLAKNGIR